MNKLLVIGTDKKIFEKKSAVRARQIEYAKRFDELHILVFASNSFVEEKISDNCWIYSTGSFTRWLYPFDAKRVGRRIIARSGITSISCEDSSLTAMAGIALKKRFNIPLEIQMHGDIGSPYFGKTISNKIRLAMARKYLLQADRVRVVSDRIKRYVERLFKDRITDGRSLPVIEVRPIIVDTEYIKNSPITVDIHKKYPQFEKIAIMASRLEPEKNISMALDAWPKVIEKYPKAGLVIIGSGSQMNDLKAQAARLGLDESIIFEGWIGGDDLISSYKTADLFINTSLFEGYGMTLVEAKASSCPTISTDVGVAREVGATIVDFDPDDLAIKTAAMFQGGSRRSDSR